MLLGVSKSNVYVWLKQGEDYAIRKIKESIDGKGQIYFVNKFKGELARRELAVIK